MALNGSVHLRLLLYLWPATLLSLWVNGSSFYEKKYQIGLKNCKCQIHRESKRDVEVRQWLSDLQNSYSQSISSRTVPNGEFNNDVTSIQQQASIYSNRRMQRKLRQKEVLVSIYSICRHSVEYTTLITDIIHIKGNKITKLLYTNKIGGTNRLLSKNSWFTYQSFKPWFRRSIPPQLLLHGVGSSIAYATASESVDGGNDITWEQGRGGGGCDGLWSIQGGRGWWPGVAVSGVEAPAMCLFISQLLFF
jgi:hypothetical protein